MLERKNYLEIARFQTKYSDCFEENDIIQISEKLDGSNASIGYDEETDLLMCFSRRQTLTSTNTLNGFYEYVQKLNKEVFIKYNNYRFLGKWNLTHIIKYQADKTKIFHCFDIYDTVNKKWLHQDDVISICKEGNINIVPIFYYGKFISWEHINLFIGKTEFGLNGGEGIVIKNMTKLNDDNERKPFIVKLVTTEFAEKIKTKVREPLNLEEIEIKKYKNDLVSQIVTKPRVEKNLYKMIEDDIVPKDWDETNMQIIARNLPSIIYNDCIKEEMDVVDKIGNDFGKLCSSHTMQIVKQLLLLQ